MPNPKDTKSFDRFAYVQNNPVNFNDPSGNMQVCPEGDEGGGCGYGTRPIDILKGYIQEKNEGRATIFWGRLKGFEKAILSNAGWNEYDFNEPMSGPGVTKADAFHDPLNYIIAIFGGFRITKAVVTLYENLLLQVENAYALTNLVPELGRKLDFLFGKATGNVDNINRSRAMLKQLESIGLFDNPAMRNYLTQVLIKTLNDPTNIVGTQDNLRVVRETLLTGPNGILKLQSIWEGVKLITFKLFGGRY